jgi:hypothetical protein
VIVPHHHELQTASEDVIRPDLPIGSLHAIDLDEHVESGFAFGFRAPPPDWGEGRWTARDLVERPR